MQLIKSLQIHGTQLRSRVSVAWYLSSQVESGIDNELVEKFSDTSFSVFVLIDLSSQPYSFWTILRVFRQLSYFLFSIFPAFSSSLIEHVKSTLTLVSQRWTNGRQTLRIIISLHIWHFVRILSSSLNRFSFSIIGQKVEVSCVSNTYRMTRETVKRHNEQAKKKEEKLL